MQLIDNINEMKAFVRSQKLVAKTIGLVPTMGFLHEGHMSLVKASKSNNDITVMSIFVNPTQFGKNEDFGKYPRDLGNDMRLAEKEGVDVIFAPTAEEVYPFGYKTYVNVEGITGLLCGKSRPGHFKGVTTIVCKLFNIIEPQRAYFGQKDAQQAIVIKQMVKDLNINVEVITCPIVREQDGLALSSRNIYLNSEERRAATILSKALFEAKAKIVAGERRNNTIKDFIKARINCEKLATIDYIEITDANTLDEAKVLRGSILIALAVKIGNTRLIDNIIIEDIQ